MPTLIQLTQGKAAVVDDADYALLAGYHWHYMGIGYAARSQGGKRIYMHRVIMGAPVGMQVDHIDGDRLNNTRSNLRICTAQQNHHNRRPLRRETSSSYKGVHFHKQTGHWRAVIRIDGRRIYLGFFHHAIDGAAAYDKAARELFGPFAYTNLTAEEAATCGGRIVYERARPNRSDELVREIARARRGVNP